MARPLHVLPADAQGLGRLAIDGVVATTDLVEHLHQAISGTIVPIPPPAPGRTRGIAGVVYRSVRGVTRLVGGTLDLALEPLVRWQPASAGTAQRDRALALLNGVIGDHLWASGNPLAQPLSLRHAGVELALGDEAHPIDASGRIAVFAHGLCMNESIWAPPIDHGPSIDHGHCTTLAGELARAGWTVVHVRYNSGRAIHANGRELAERMAGLCRQWPVPVERLALIGHSMGGLIWRSAVHQALSAGHDWTPRVDSMVFLGTPHRGAPLERAGYGIDRLLGASRFSLPFTRLGRIRSAGIIDLRDGNVVPPESDAARKPGETLTRPAPHVSPRLPVEASCFAVAAALGKRADDLRARRVGDGLVPVPSALGEHKDPARRLPVDRAHRLVVCGIGHVELVHHPEVVRRVSDWLT
jgi:hypothetical protein